MVLLIIYITCCYIAISSIYGRFKKKKINYLELIFFSTGSVLLFTILLILSSKLLHYYGFDTF